MYDHIGLKVKDVEASARFYKAALAPLGFVLDSQDESGAGLGPKGAPALWLYRADRKSTASGTHVCFSRAGSRGGRSLPRRRAKAGGRDNGTPGVRKDYGPKYYAAFLLDPDGNNVEAVCMK